MNRDQEFITRLYALLNDNNYYSLEIIYTAKKLGSSMTKLLNYDYNRNTDQSRDFEQLTNDHINVFRYNDVTYIGLESRRLDYERDKQLGVNWVEDSIKAGLYR